MPLNELTRPRTRDEVLRRMLLALPQDFPLNNYHSGDPLRTLLEVAAESIADTERTVAALGAGGYLQTARGAWLDELTRSVHGITRKPSVFTRGPITLTAAPGFGPYTILPGTMHVGTPSGLRFSALDGGTLPEGGQLTLEVQAEAPGSIYNTVGGSITVLHTPLPGVSVTNAPNWITRAGADEESDDALALRASLRWAELGGGATAAAYRYWALTASPSVTQVAVLDQHPRGQGTVDVVLWGAGGLGPGVVADTAAFIESRRPLAVNVSVYSATPRVVHVPLTLNAPGQDRARIEGEITATLAALQQATGIGGILYRSALIEAAMLPAGMLDARLPTSIPDALPLDRTEALVLNVSYAWSSV